MKRVDANETTLSGYLSLNSDINTLTIPFSQRPYEWGKTQVERLFNDLVSLYFDNTNVHMLNFFTLSGEDDRTKIFDGQQRTITSMLILGSFIKKLDQLGRDKAADQLYSDYIEKVDHVSGAGNVKKLKFDNQAVEDYFYSLLNPKEETGEDYGEDNDTIQTLEKNYAYINQLLETFISKHKLDDDDLLMLISRILQNTNLITIKTDTDELAMAMFESLNNTGKKLENYYVLKNDLVIALGEDKVKDKWNEIESHLANYDQSDFLTALATALNGKSTKSNVLTKIYQVYPKHDSAKMAELLDLMVDASEKYLYLRNPAQLTDYEDRKVFEKYSALIASVNLFITKQHHPLLLAFMMKERPLEHINQVLAQLLSLGIRNFYFQESRANTIEKPIAELAKSVYVDDLATVDVLKQLQKLEIPKAELKEAIKAKVVKAGTAEKRLKFILRETYNHNDLDKELEIKKDIKDIHYEHILPKSPKNSSQWLKDFKVEEERALYTAKVGNATLLLGKINKNISNKDFAEKRELYSESHIPENKRIAQKNQWTAKEIDQRGNDLADKIINYLDSLVI